MKTQAERIQEEMQQLSLEMAMVLEKLQQVLLEIKKDPCRLGDICRYIPEEMKGLEDEKATAT